MISICTIFMIYFYFFMFEVKEPTDKHLSENQRKKIPSCTAELKLLKFVGFKIEINEIWQTYVLQKKY